MPRTAIDWNSIPLHIKEIEGKDKFKAAVSSLLPNISASNQFSQQRNCTNPTRSGIESYSSRSRSRDH